MRTRTAPPASSAKASNSGGMQIPAKGRTALCGAPRASNSGTGDLVDRIRAARRSAAHQDRARPFADAPQLGALAPVQRFDSEYAARTTAAIRSNGRDCRKSGRIHLCNQLHSRRRHSGAHSGSRQGMTVRRSGSGFAASARASIDSRPPPPPSSPPAAPGMAFHCASLGRAGAAVAGGIAWRKPSIR